MKNKRDRLFFTQLFVPQASQSSYDRRTELEVLFAIPSAQSACGMEIRMKAVPIELKDAQNYINAYHRHHQASHRDKFRIAAMNDGKIVGVVQVGRPVSRYLDDGKTLEVLRLCTDGTKDACSFLYSRAARIAKEMGYEKIITYILESELGTSLKASGWRCETVNAGGANWNVPSRPREVIASQLSFFPEKTKYPLNEKKQRWSKELK